MLTPSREPDLSLREFLVRFPAQPAEPIPDAWLDLPLRLFRITPVTLSSAAGEQRNTPNQKHVQQPDAASSPRATRSSSPDPGSTAPNVFPDMLTDKEAVGRAYPKEIKAIGGYLRNDLSVLVVCDKVLAEYIFRHAVPLSGKAPLLEDEPGAIGDVVSPGSRIGTIGRLLAGIKPAQVLVMRHLDVLASSNADGFLTTEARMLVDVLYRSQEFTPTLLGFVDPSLGLPSVLTARFAVHIELAGLSCDSIPRLVTAAERDRFAPFDSETLFKNVSGFNAIQLRNAMRYLHSSSRPGTSTLQLMKLLREFKRGSGEDVEIPNITFDQIGGYTDVKQELFDAIQLITGYEPRFNPDGSPFPAPSIEIDIPLETDEEREKRRKLAPHGFIFHGPPGTGKTLFAKAIANAMNATIQMVSGPEIMDMWLGKSESNLRRLFAVARRNAPAVIFFDEFDSIAARRDRGLGDSGSRAMNAVVAQLLTEMDGFRTDQEYLGNWYDQPVRYYRRSAVTPLALPADRDQTAGCERASPDCRHPCCQLRCAAARPDTS